MTKEQALTAVEKAIEKAFDTGFNRGYALCELENKELTDTPLIIVNEDALHELKKLAIDVCPSIRQYELNVILNQLTF